jgi:hypothetical protein
LYYSNSTAVGTLLSALIAQGTPGLAVLKSLRAWACSALLYKLVYAIGKGRPVFDDPTAVLLQKTQGKLSTSSSSDWHAVLCEVGAVVLAMASVAATASTAATGVSDNADDDTADTGAALLATIKRYQLFVITYFWFKLCSTAYSHACHVQVWICESSLTALSLHTQACFAHACSYTCRVYYFCCVG